MVYAHKVRKITLSGTMFGGLEVWSTGFFMGLPTADAADPTQAEADAIKGAWSTFFSASGASISNNYQFTQCKVALLGIDGQTVDGKTFYSYPGATVSGWSASGTLPPQCSLVATLTSAIPRGRGSKGRMYLPGIATSIGSDGHLPATPAASIPTALQTFFNAVTDSFDVPNQVIIASKGTGLVPEANALNTPITGLRIGNVIDTQRRRRNGLTEVYTAKTLTNA